ncbi:MAG: aminotransferase class V-fold PLP-dependent enzyme [Methylacidiphilales bacterium]|nr:aminotransferase class V-fold PLP-dependent enzyme [Candidatus Methylacidiphilales bacterium]
MNTLTEVLRNEELRRRLFPVAKSRAFFAHAGVTALPQPACEALRWFADQACEDQQEGPAVWMRVQRARKTAANLIGAKDSEIALLGPTALGLNLVADGLSWQAGDEVICYQDDYPANVYPWIKLRARGVVVRFLQPGEPGKITWETLRKELSPKTKLVALATANFISGYRIDAEGIGKKLHERGVLFCLDGIQTLGAFPLSVEHVDFLSADSHKWLLGPLGAGIFYVKEEHFGRLRPALLGSWNVQSPNFIAQDTIEFYEGARRYEPGSLNVPGILAMQASMEFLLEIGVNAVAARLLELRRYLVPRLTALGFDLYGMRDISENECSGILTFYFPKQCDRKGLMSRLQEKKISVSLRHNRAGEELFRVSPHFYNTEQELDQLVETCAEYASGR